MFNGINTRLLVQGAILVPLLLVLCGCNLVAQADELGPPTATTVSVMRATAVPTLERVYQPVAATAPAVAAGASPQATEAPAESASTGCSDTDSADRRAAQHRVEAEINYGERSIQARQQINYLNRLDETLTDFVINIEPNRWPEAFTLLGVLQKHTREGTVTPSYSLTGRRLYVELVEPLESGCSLDLEMLFTIRVPQVQGGVNAYKGYFGHSARQMNLGHWLPSVAVRMGGEWITRQAMFVGEQEVVDKADWDLNLTVTNARDTLTVAAPGQMEMTAPMEWRIQLQNARDLTMSISEDFIVETRQASSGAIVELYSFPDAEFVDGSGRMIDAANHALNVALRSLESYEKLFGPYVYERMLVVQGDFPDGMEFSGIVFVSTDWFKWYPGDAAAFLTLITVHEVSHQWFYARVGNDPALAPWLDEALATYSEYIFLEEYYPSLTEWWWEFRVNSHAPGGFVDSTVYEFTTIREYINAVYLRGVIMLHAIRSDIGTEAFFDLIRRYVEAGDGLVVSPDLFWSLMTPEQLTATERTRSVYLRRPTVSAGGG